jgi:hypothetical protein
MSRIYYYITKLSVIFHLETGSVSKIYKNSNSNFITGALHFKNKYSHNFWTEIRGGKRIDTFEVFKSKYTYLDI